MAELLGMDSSMFTSAFSGFSGAVTYIFMLCLVVAILWGCMYLLSFKHKVRINKETQSGNNQQIDTKARQFKTKDGVVKWRFLKYMKDTHPAPQHNAISLTDKGKFSADCVMSMSGQVTWLKRDIAGNKSLELSGEEVQSVVDEMRRAEEYKKKRLSEILMQWQGAIILVMILLVFMLFFNKTVEPSIALGNSLQSASEDLREATDRLATAYERAYPDGISLNGTRVGKEVPGQIITNAPN